MWQPEDPDAASPAPEASESEAEPDGAVALSLADWAGRTGGGLIHVARSDTRAARIAAALSRVRAEINGSPSAAMG